MRAYRLSFTNTLLVDNGGKENASSTIKTKLLEKTDAREKVEMDTAILGEYVLETPDSLDIEFNISPCSPDGTIVAQQITIKNPPIEIISNPHQFWSWEVQFRAGTLSSPLAKKFITEEDDRKRLWRDAKELPLIAFGYVWQALPDWTPNNASVTFTLFADPNPLVLPKNKKTNIGMWRTNAQTWWAIQSALERFYPNIIQKSRQGYKITRGMQCNKERMTEIGTVLAEKFRKDGVGNNVSYSNSSIQKSYNVQQVKSVQAVLAWVKKNLKATIFLHTPEPHQFVVMTNDEVAGKIDAAITKKIDIGEYEGQPEIEDLPYVTLTVSLNGDYRMCDIVELGADIASVVNLSPLAKLPASKYDSAEAVVNEDSAKKIIPKSLRFEPTFIMGKFLVIQVQHIGQYRGQEWKTVLRLVKIQGTDKASSLANEARIT